jgi:hypothetical protein
MGDKSIETKLLENMVELQKVHTNLLEKFDKLSSQVASLLNLFEMTAKTFADNPASNITQKDREFLDKIDKLLEQNKTIAKGLILMEDKIKGKPQVPQVQMQAPTQMMAPQMQMMQQPNQIPSPLQESEPPEQQFQPSMTNFPISGKPLPKF